MKNKFLTLCIDIESFDLPNEFGTGISRDEGYEISLQGLDLLFNLLNEFDVKVTFFVTEDMAIKFPKKIKRLVLTGHEIALHSIIQAQNEAEIVEALREQKLHIENVTGTKILGHRSHKLLLISLEKLKKVGLLYDNSLHPTYVPGRYCNIFRPRKLYKECDIFEVPVTVTPLLRFPFSWFWFRTFNFLYAKLCSKFTYRKQEYINIYFHSWDFANIPDITLNWPYKLLLHNLGDKMLFNFRNYLDWVKKENISVVTMLMYVKNQLVSDDNKQL